MARGGRLSLLGAPIPFFTDNDVPNEVGDVLLDAGHLMVRLREVMLEDSADPIVAAACRERGLVLVTHNVRHFRSLAQSFEARHGQPDHLCRIELECSQIHAAGRIRAALGLIEAEWLRLGDDKRGLRISIKDRLISTHR